MSLLRIDKETQQIFLEQIANHYKFQGDRRKVFIKRFSQDTLEKRNNKLAEEIWNSNFYSYKKGSDSPSSMFQRHLAAICETIRLVGL